MDETYHECRECLGTCRIANGCTHCRGNGYVRTLEMGLTQLIEPTPRGLPGAGFCPRCHGRGYEMAVCRLCDGHGYLTQDYSLSATAVV